MVNKEYISLVYQRQSLVNKKDKTDAEKKENYLLGKQMTEMEKAMPVEDIFASVRDAYKHIAARL